METLEPTDVPAANLFRLILGGWTSQMLAVVARLGIADLLSDGPRRTSELAEACGAHPLSLERVISALVQLGVFEQSADGRIALTPLGDSLRTGADSSLRGVAVVCGQAWHTGAWSDLLHSVKTGEPGFDRQHEQPLADFLRTHEEASGWYEAALANLALTPPGLLDPSLAAALLSVETLVISHDEPALLEKLPAIPSLDKKSA